MVAEAYDTRQLPVPGVWQPMPVAPALVTWQLRQLSRKVATRGVAADFRRSTPPNERFWNTYARGTYQNMSVFGPRYSWAQPGCFLFKLTRAPFDTSSVPDGVYDLVVTVTDTPREHALEGPAPDDPQPRRLVAPAGAAIKASLWRAVITTAATAANDRPPRR